MYALRDRGRALEDKFAYDQTLNFKIQARRTRMLGFWAASVLKSENPELYAEALVMMSVGGRSDAEIATKLRHDFDAAGVAVSATELQNWMNTLLATAQVELEAA